MVMDANGMGHKPAGTVGGGQFENKAGATSDDDLDALFDNGVDLGAIRRADEQRAQEERKREWRKRAASASARVGVALQDREAKRYIVRGILQNGKAVVEVPYEDKNPLATQGLLALQNEDKAFADNGLDPSYSLSHIHDEWVKRGVNMKFDLDGGQLKCVFTPVGDVRDKHDDTDASGECFKSKQGSYSKSQGEKIPYTALNETERKAIDRQVEEWSKLDDQLGDERYYSEETKRKVGESIDRYGVARLPYPDGFDGAAYVRGWDGEFKNSKGETTRYDFEGIRGSATPMEDATEKSKGAWVSAELADGLEGDKFAHVGFDFREDCIYLRDMEAFTTLPAPLIDLGK